MTVSQNTELQNQIADLNKTVADLNKTVEFLRIRLEDVAQISSKQGERVIIMIDRSNLDQTWRRIDNTGMRPDYVKMKDYLADGRFLKQVRIYYSDVDFDMVPEGERAAWQSRQDFYSFLRHQGWVLRGVKKKIYDGMPVEKGLDGTLIRDMAEICRDGRCDTLVLVAGDADYCDVVGDVQERHCVRVEVAFFPNQTARDLQMRATRFINLECVKEKIVRKPSY